MAEIIRNRTIRPSSRKATSINYRVHVDAVLVTDTLTVNITHESSPFQRTFRFSGNDLANKNNISFRVMDFGTHLDIIWSGAQPLN